MSEARRRSRRTRAGLGAALALALAACAPSYGDGYLASLAAGQRASQAGRYDEAARAFDEAARKGQRVKDRDEARFLQARSLSRSERWADAERAYRQLVTESPSGPRSARAEFEIADLAIEHGDAEKGFALLLEATRRHPEHGLARHAVARLAEHAAERGGDEAALAWLDATAPGFHGTELDQVFAYERARLLEKMGRHEQARDAYVTTAKSHPYPFGGLTDDALWRAAEIDEELGRHGEAIEHLRQLLAPREVSTLSGSYERPRFSEAQLRIGLIYRDGLRDHAAARRELHKVFTDHPTSILRDDALWAEARIAREDGDAEGACEAVRLLVRELADSRYVPCAKLLCPSAPEPETKGKPRECNDYIRRELGRPSTPSGPEPDPTSREPAGEATR